jgi:hypothetical protein
MRTAPMASCRKNSNRGGDNRHPGPPDLMGLDHQTGCRRAGGPSVVDRKTGFRHPTPVPLSSSFAAIIGLKGQARPLATAKPLAMPTIRRDASGPMSFRRLCCAPRVALLLSAGSLGDHRTSRRLLRRGPNSTIRLYPRRRATPAHGPPRYPAPMTRRPPRAMLVALAQERRRHRRPAI